MTLMSTPRRCKQVSGKAFLPLQSKVTLRTSKLKDPRALGISRIQKFWIKTLKKLSAFLSSAGSCGGAAANLRLTRSRSDWSLIRMVMIRHLKPIFGYSLSSRRNPKKKSQEDVCLQENHRGIRLNYWHQSRLANKSALVIATQL